MAANHIVSCLQHLDGGGVERALLRLAGGWAAAGRRVTLIVGDDRGPLAAEWPAGVARVITGSRLLPKLAWTAMAAPGDLLFCPGNHYASGAAAARLSPGWRRGAIVVKLSNTLARRDHALPVRLGYRAFLRSYPRFADQLVALTPGLAAEAATLTGMAPNRIAVIANPPAQIDPTTPQSAWPAGRFLVGVGRLSRQKRWDRLIAALPALPADVGLLLLGEGEARAALTAQIARLGLAGRVAMPGYVADPLPAMAHATALVLTSSYEGSPGVIAEALAQQTPVVATDASPAIRELIATPDAGEVVPIDDPAMLVAALRRRLAPEAARPAAVVTGGDPIAAYLNLFDAAVAERAAKRAA